MEHRLGWGRQWCVKLAKKPKEATNAAVDSIIESRKQLTGLRILESATIKTTDGTTELWQ